MTVIKKYLPILIACILALLLVGVFAFMAMKNTNTKNIESNINDVRNSSSDSQLTPINLSENNVILQPDFVILVDPSKATNNIPVINTSETDANGKSYSIDYKDGSKQISLTLIRDYNKKPVLVDMGFSKNGDKYNVEIKGKGRLKSGKYTLDVAIIENGVTKHVTQDFRWGVLAYNSDKSIYLPGETANFTMAILDDIGKMVCNASANLYVKDPSGKETIFSTEDGSILIGADCEYKKYTEIPDFSSQYKVDQIGTYEIKLTAKNNEETYSIYDKFEVRSSVDFDVKRVSATRIYPVETYPVIIVVKANKDYNGIVEESVYSEFKIVSNDQNASIIQADPNNPLSYQKLEWNVDFKKGQTYTLSYQYKAPDRSPDFYTLGPLKIGSFYETRRWQIAADQVSVYVGSFTKSTDSTPPNATNSITSIPFKPKGIIFYWTGATVNDTVTAHDIVGIGHTAGSSGNSVSFFSDDASGNSNSGYARSVTYTLVIQASTGTIVATGITTLTDNGFDVSWNVNNAVATIINYIAIGGEEIENVTHFYGNIATSGATQQFNPLTFKPDALMFLWSDAGAEDTNNTDAQLGIGFATSPIDEWAIVINSEDGRATMDTWRYQKTGSSILHVTKTTGAFDAEADLKSFDSNGFTLNVTDLPAATLPFYYLAIKGGSYKAGSYTQSTTNVTNPVPAPFLSSGVIISSSVTSPMSAVGANNSFTFGAASSSSAYNMIWGGDEDNLAVSDTNMLISQTKILDMRTGANPTVSKGTATLSSFSESKYSLTWSGVDGLLIRQFLYFAIGPTKMINFGGNFNFNNLNINQ